MDDSTAKLYSTTLEFLGKLAWPAVILYALYKFRVQLSQLLTRLGSVKVAGSEWVFQAPTDKAPEPSKDLRRTKLEVGADGFLNALSIRAAVTESGLLDADELVTDELLIFHTPNQRTWLVATGRNVFVLLDDQDTRKDARLIQTFFDRTKTLPIQCRRSDGADVVKFAAEDIWWYYSVHLFPTPSALRDAITRLVKSRN